MGLVPLDVDVSACPCWGATLQGSNAEGEQGRRALACAPLCLIRHVGWNKIPSGVSREASVRLLRALKSGDQGRVQCYSNGTFDTRGTVRTRRSRSIKRTQGPAADRAASQQGVRRTTHAQQSTRGICPHSHREESSRQQVGKDRRIAEQRDELAPSYVEYGASPPLRALGASNDHQLAGGPQPCRQELRRRRRCERGSRRTRLLL